MGVNVRTTAMFREASTFTFLFSHHIFTSLRAASPFVVSQYFVPCRISLCFELSDFYSLPSNFRLELTPTFIPCQVTSVSNSLRLLFPAEQLPFPTHSNFYSLPSNFCFQLTPAFIRCRASRSNRHPNFYFATNSF